MNPDTGGSSPAPAQPPPAAQQDSAATGHTGRGSVLLQELKPLLLLLLVLAILAFGGLALFIYRMFNPSQVRSLDAYPKYLAKFQRTWAPHFPAEIPADATLKKFCYFPGVGSGHWYMQLRLQRPAEQIRSLYSQSLSQRTASFHGGSHKEHSLQPDGMATTFFYTGDEPTKAPFPPDYEIMVFDPILTSEQKQQNHSYLFCHGVAISLQRNEIIYWSATW
ncbi:hypothetical protein [Prosthecobacter vanneervenii]|uniref:Uncharacterized protein n=1 Tax=Prosthecobacter vanneervenii TaxID=48466 RepID=A0A7W7YGJ3_9BACT|nr:hypothetical protein [Prosthecobacter vanneervenii]MBB5035445.1 hypothetical protein [Prosthecobacter vanneervenii]